MGWTETQRYYRLLRDVADELERAGDGIIPWRPEYADAFGTPHGLWLALRRRWELMVQAQVDGPADLIALVAAHRGLLLALTRHDPATTRTFHDQQSESVDIRPSSSVDHGEVLTGAA